MKIAVCPGSFDPVTVGHLDIITRASKLFGKVIVAVAVNTDKKYSFTVEERINLLKIATLDLGLDVQVEAVDGLLVDYAKKVNADAIIKGLRAVTDFEYEFQMALTNKKLNEDLETLLMPTNSENMFLSSSIVKQIAGFGGDISHFVPKCLLEDIENRLCVGSKNSK